MFDVITDVVSEGLVDGLLSRSKTGMKVRRYVVLLLVAVFTIMALAYVAGFVFPDV